MTPPDDAAPRGPEQSAAEKADDTAPRGNEPTPAEKRDHVAPRDGGRDPKTATAPAAAAVAPRRAARPAAVSRTEPKPVAAPPPILRGGEETGRALPESPRTVSEARERIAATRERLSATSELLKQRLDIEKKRMENRFDVVSRLRDAMEGKELLALGGAFAGGLVLALLGRRRRVDADDLEALRAWADHRDRVLAALVVLEEEED